MPMLQSLYLFYKDSPLSLYDIRKHYLEHYYYQNHRKKEASGVLNMIVNSSKISALLEQSFSKKKAPSCEDIASTVNSILKLLLKSNETQVLAALDAALRWDIEVNAELKLKTSEELKKEMVRVFKIYSVYEEITEEEFRAMNPNSSEESESTNNDSTEDVCIKVLKPQKKANKLKTWSLTSFTEQFGDLQVAAFTNRTTGEIFVSCVCMKGKKKTYVAFSSKLGELTPEEIEEMKDDLVVVQLPSGRYSLAKPKNGAWKDVNI